VVPMEKLMKQRCARGRGNVDAWGDYCKHNDMGNLFFDDFSKNRES
jgi:hypothetical protein